MCNGMKCPYENLQGECKAKSNVPHDGYCVQMQCEICTSIFDSHTVMFDVKGTVYCEQCLADYMADCENEE